MHNLLDNLARQGKFGHTFKEGDACCCALETEPYKLPETETFGSWEYLALRKSSEEIFSVYK